MHRLTAQVFSFLFLILTGAAAQEFVPGRFIVELEEPRKGAERLAAAQ